MSKLKPKVNGTTGSHLRNVDLKMSFTNLTLFQFSENNKFLMMSLSLFSLKVLAHPLILRILSITVMRLDLIMGNLWTLTKEGKLLTKFL